MLNQDELGEQTLRVLGQEPPPAHAVPDYTVLRYVPRHIGKTGHVGIDGSKADDLNDDATISSYTGTLGVLVFLFLVFANPSSLHI